VKRRYQGVCRGCGAPTTARGGKGDAYAFCKNCHPGAIAPMRTREGCATRCTSGASDTAGLPRQPTGRGRTPADAAAQHSSGCELATGRPRRPSLTSTGRGVRLTQTRSPTADGHRLPGPAAATPGTYQTRCPASFRSTTTQPTRIRRRSTVGTSCRSPTQRSCSNASAASAPTFKASAS